MSDAVTIEPITCFRCGYDVRALPREGACPECGLGLAESARAYTSVRMSIDRKRLRATRDGLIVALVAWGALIIGAIVVATIRSPLGGFIATIPLMVHALAMLHVSDSVQALTTGPAHGQGAWERALRYSKAIRVTIVFGGAFLAMKLGVSLWAIAAIVLGVRVVTMAALESTLRRVLGGLSAETPRHGRWLSVALIISWATFLPALIFARPLGLPFAPLLVTGVAVALVDGVTQFAVLRVVQRASGVLLHAEAGRTVAEVRHRIPYKPS